MIYFICDGGWQEEGSCVKVGYSKNSGKNRLYELQVGNPKELDIIWEINGSRVLELQVHELFKEFYIRGEWFWYTKSFNDLLNEFADERERIVERIRSCSEERSVKFISQYYESKLISWIWDKLEGGI